MKYVVADTETSGLFDYSKPADADGQPRMAQLALCVLREDLSIERHASFLIKPDGWVMNEETAKIHGLTQERLEAEGEDISQALGLYNALLDEGYIVIGYNVSFDLKMMRAELRRAGLPDRFESTSSIDCMRPMEKVCKIAKANGKGLKLPKLIEAYEHCFGVTIEGAHDALQDARACAAIFRWMVEKEIFSPAQLTGVKEI
jgi:DNA polymerase III subunit epsilon